MFSICFLFPVLKVLAGSHVGFQVIFWNMCMQLCSVFLMSICMVYGMSVMSSAVTSTADSGVYPLFYREWYVVFVDVYVTPLCQVAVLAAVILVSFGAFVVYGAGPSYYGYFFLFIIECQVGSPCNVGGCVQVPDKFSGFLGEFICGICVSAA